MAEPASGRTRAVPTLVVRAVPESRGTSRCHARGVLRQSRSRRVPGVVGVAAAGTVATALAAVATLVVLDHNLDRIGRPDLRQLTGVGVVFGFALASSAAVGAVLLVRRPRHPVGWCFAGLAACIAVAAVLTAYGVWGALARPGSLPAAAAAANVQNVLFIAWNTLVGLVCYLTPTGRPLSPRWAWCARVMVASGGVWLVTGLLSAAPLEAPFATVPNPWALDALDTPVQALRAAGAVVNSALILVGAASLLVRFRRAVGDERRQLLWMAAVAVPVPLLLVVAFVASRTGHDGLLELAAGSYVAILPVAAALAITKYHLYDVERVLSRAASYLVVSAVLAATYAAVVVFVARGVGQAAGRSQLGIALATLAVATAARPVYRVVQEGIDRRFARRRFEALRVVRQFVAAPEPDRTIEQVLRQALGDGSLSVAYWVAGRRQWVTGDGRAVDPPAGALQVDRAGRPVARVSSAAIGAEPELTRAVVGAAEPELDNAGLRAAVALQVEEIRASRARITAAQLDERRRVERDLHDGAQQRLLALAAQLQAALLNGDPERLRDAMAAGVRESRTAVRELRELANGLHPSVLSDGGLTAALDEVASRLPVRVHSADPNRRYPDRVEATAWFIASEAVANALKHADARRVDVTVEAEGDELRLTVDDDGLGGADPDGSGLRGLADRAEAVGGRLVVGPGAVGGTSVQAVLPCAS